jgi:hypothetical protein
MAQCPSCSNNTDDDFGLVTCGACGAQFMVDINGQALAAEVSAVPTATSEQSYVEPVMPIEAEAAEVAQEVPQQLFPPQAPEDIVRDETMGTSTSTIVTKPRQAARQSTNNDMRDIAQFANSESSLGRDGMLRYNIYISGVDTKDLRYEVKEILTDGKFRWNVDDIMTSIVDGEIRLMEVPAVKSALIIQKLKVLPLEIRWEQFSITQN